MRRYSLGIPVDRNYFFVTRLTGETSAHDEEVSKGRLDTDSDWGRGLVWRWEGTLFVWTLSYFGGQISLETWPQAPPDDWSEWEYVVDAPLGMAGPEIGVYSPSEGNADAYPVPSGPLMVRVSARDLDRADPEDLGEEIYRVQVWPHGADEGIQIRQLVASHPEVRRRAGQTA